MKVAYTRVLRQKFRIFVIEGKEAMPLFGIRNASFTARILTDQNVRSINCICNNGFFEGRLSVAILLFPHFCLGLFSFGLLSTSVKFLCIHF
jgi:hypothetical protein